MTHPVAENRPAAAPLSERPTVGSREDDGLSNRLTAAVQVLRPHQWVKNVLLFLPLVMAHVVPWQGPGNRASWIAAALAFVAFSLTASSVYVVNDLLDIDADRAHPAKRHRPFASARLPVMWGPPLVLLLWAAAAGLCVFLPGRFALWLAVYLLVSTAYSLFLKAKLLVDIMVLAGLYTLRILAGGAVTAVPVSKWLLAFSIFLFVSLAFAKRYTELLGVERGGQRAARGRSYEIGDLKIIESVGPASGYLAVMVLALYINDAGSGSAHLYPAQDFLWMLCPLLMYWITRIWFFARRGVLDDDPILFAIKDRVSWMALALAAVLVVCASVWHP